MTNDMNEEENKKAKSVSRKFARFFTLAAVIAIVTYFFTGDRGEKNRTKTKQVLQSAKNRSKKGIDDFRAEMKVNEYDTNLGEVFQEYREKVSDFSEGEFAKMKQRLRDFLDEGETKPETDTLKPKKRVKKKTKKKIRKRGETGNED